MPIFGCHLYHIILLEVFILALAVCDSTSLFFDGVIDASQHVFDWKVNSNVVLCKLGKPYNTETKLSFISRVLKISVFSFPDIWSCVQFFLVIQVFLVPDLRTSDGIHDFPGNWSLRSIALKHCIVLT